MKTNSFHKALWPNVLIDYIDCIAPQAHTHEARNLSTCHFVAFADSEKSRTFVRENDRFFGCQQTERLNMKASRNPRRYWLPLLALFLQAGIVGCGGRGLYPVKGQVIYKDGSDVSVLARGLVVFDPADPEAPKTSSRGEIQKDGSFQMSTYTEGDGVPPGKYRVMVAPPLIVRKHRDDVLPQLLDERYRDFATSGLEITVNGAMDDYTVTVER